MLPAAPDSMVATELDGQVTLAWLDPGDLTIDGYQWRGRSLFQNQFTAWDNIKDSDSTTTTYTWGRVLNGYWFNFEVRALNEAGAGDSSSVRTVSGPPPPGFSASGGDRSVTLTWDNLGGASELGYEIRHGAGEAPPAWATIDVTPKRGSSTTTRTVTDLTNGTAYTFEVRAKFVVGGDDFYGVPSRVTTAPVAPPPSAPSGLTASPRDRSVVLAWLAAGDTTLTGYQARHAEAGAEAVLDEMWLNIEPVSDDTAKYHTVENLTNGIEYAFEVRALRGLVIGDSARVTATPLPPPSAPDSLTATVGDSAVTLAWGDPGDISITEYELRYAKGGVGDYYIRPNWANREWRRVAPNSAANRRMTVENLTNVIAYTFELRAKNVSGTGDSSSVVAHPSEAPRGLEALGREGAVTVTWYGPDFVGGFEYRRDKGDDDTPPDWAEPEAVWKVVNPDSAANGRLTVEDLDDGSAYRFELRVVDKKGNKGTTPSGVTETPGPRPAAPDTLTATVGDAAVTLTWADPEDGNVTGYELRHVSNGIIRGAANWTDIEWREVDADSAANRRVTVKDSLTNGSPYTFALRALYAAGAGASSTVGASPAGAPQGLEAEAGDSTVTLTWDGVDYTIGGYEHRRDMGNNDNPPDWEGEDALWRSLAADNRRVTVDSLMNGSPYTFEVRVVDIKGNKGTTATSVIDTPLAPLVAPDSLTATAGDREVTLNWKKAVDGAITGYQLRYGGKRHGVAGMGRHRR